MTATMIANCLEPGVTLVRTNSDFQVDDCGGCSKQLTIVFAQASDITITLPKNPCPGQEVLVIADGVSGVVVQGSPGAPLFSGPVTLDMNGRVQVTFTPSGQFLITDDAVSAAFLSQATWHINAVTGNNSNDGKTAATALKTWAEWQRRVGTWTTLTPSGGTLRIFVDSDLPQSDPITFINIIGPGATAFIIGKKKVVASGTVAAVIPRNRFTNTPWEVVASGVPAGVFAGNEGLFFYVTSGPNAGSTAIVARNLGGTTAHLGSFSQGSDPSGFGIPGSPPLPGNTFRLTSFVTVYIGYLVFISYSSQPGPVNIVPGGLLLQNLRLPDTGSVGVPFPEALSNAPAPAGYDECIFPPFSILTAKAGTGNVLGNCSFQDFSLVQISAGTLLTSQSVWTTQGSSIQSDPGARIVMGDDPTFVGQDSFVNVYGLVLSGPASAWNEPDVGGLVVNRGGSFQGLDFDPVSGENGYPNLWGDAQGEVFGFTDSGMTLLGTGFGVDPPVPTRTGRLTPDGIINFGFISNDEDTALGVDTKSFVWIRASATYQAPGGIKNQWANLDILHPAGFKTDDMPVPSIGATRVRLANANNPAVRAGLNWATFTF